MFDDVPVGVWLLIAIAAVAYGPAHYVYRYLANSPSRRDITQPPEGLSWRTSSQFARSSTILAALVAVAVFIFTPVAAQFAKSPSFLPILMIGLGAWALFTVLRGFAFGQIQPFIQGNNSTYEREAKPKRFWASMAWNAVFGSLCFWLAFDINGQAIKDRCYDEGTVYSPQEELSACNKLIGKRDKTGDNLANLVAGRGFAYHRLGDYRHAIVDYTNAIRLNPRDPYPRFNRALIYQHLGDSRRAVRDYGAAIGLRTNDPDAYLNRGLIFVDTGNFDEAVADFTSAHELRPKDPWPLANRGITYAWKKDQARAEKDFKAVRAIDPSNPVVLRGEALLSMNAGDMKAAVYRLTAALNREPDNDWSLRMRAKAYQQLGEYEKSQEDTNEDAAAEQGHEWGAARPPLKCSTPPGLFPPSSLTSAIHPNRPSIYDRSPTAS